MSEIQPRRKGAVEKKGGLLLDQIRYDNELISVKAAGQIVERRAECSDITFINLSGATCQINGFPLLSGAAITYPCNRYEYNKTVYKIQVNAVTVGNLGVWIVRKSYTGLVIDL